MDLKELESGVDPKTHWYYQSKKIPMLKFMRNAFAKSNKKLTLVDVGSGSGFFMYEAMEAIPEMIEKVWLVDINYTQEEINATKNQIIEKRLDLPDNMQNAVVVMMDVLEHLEDDALMLREIKERATGKNYFFITVPAFKDLWSGHDVYLGHYRRYVRKTLTSVLQKENYKIESCSYLYFAIFPLVWLVRKLSSDVSKPTSSMKPASSPINSILKAYNSFEMNSGKWNKIFGVTCTAQGEI